MIVLKSPREIEMMKKSGEILAACHKELAKIIKPGITTWEIENFVDQFLKEHGAVPEQKDIRDTNMQHAQALTMKFAMDFPEKIL